MESSNGIVGIVITALLSAVGWLAKRLYDAPRQSEVLDRDKRIASLESELSTFRQKTADAVDQARDLINQRDNENRQLRDELADLRVAIERRFAGGDAADARSTTRRPTRAHRPNVGRTDGETR